MGAASIELMAEWMKTVKVPITVVVALAGAAGGVSAEDRELWADLGVKRSVCRCKGGFRHRGPLRVLDRRSRYTPVTRRVLNIVSRNGYHFFAIKLVRVFARLLWFNVRPRAVRVLSFLLFSTSVLSFDEP